MPMFMATKLGIQFARFAAASGNAGSASLRGAFNNATSSSTSSATSSWAQGLSSGGSASANGAGIGGAKFHAGRGAHSSFQQSGRALANANASSSHDGSNSIGDDEEELTYNQARIHRPGQLHRSALIGRQFSQSHSRLIRVKGEAYKTSLSALQLILPRAEHASLIGSASPAHVRTLTSDTTTNSAEFIETGTTPLERGRITETESLQVKKERTDIKRRHGRSNSMGPTIGKRVGVPGKEEGVGIEAIFDNASGSKSQRSINDLQRNDDSEERSEMSKELKDLQNALNRQADAVTIRSYVQIYRNTDKNRQSVSGFNKAIEALLSLKSLEIDMDEIASLYLQMTESSFRPNRRTWDLLIASLCYRDYYDFSLGSQSDERYDSAFSLFKLAHTTSDIGFSRMQPYNILLRSCAIRGDTRRACDVMEKITKNPRIEPSAITFFELLRCFSNESKPLEGESEIERNERVLKTTQKIFDESEKRRDIDGDPRGSHNLSVWNCMIETYFKFDDSASALALVERLVTDPSAPRSDLRTTELLLDNLMIKGEFVDAVSWLERIIDVQRNLSQENKKDDKGLMKAHKGALPLPSDGKIVGYTTTIRDYLLSLKDQDQYNSDTSALFVSAQLPSQVASALLNVAESSTLNDGQYNMLLSTVRNALQCNDIIFDKCFEKDEIAASALMDKSLELIHRLSQIVKPSNAGNSNDEDIHKSQSLARAIFFIVGDLTRLKRFQDAASAFTYAIHFSTVSNGTENSLNGKTTMLIDRNIKLLNATSTLLLGNRSIEMYGGDIKALSSEELKKYAGQILIANTEMVLPSMEPLRSNWNWQQIFPRLMELYDIVRKEIDAKDLPLSAKGWNALIDAFVAVGESKQESMSDLELLKDVSSLPKDLLDNLNLSSLARLTIQKHKKEAEEILNAIDPKLIAAEHENVSSSSDFTESLSSPNTVATSEANLTMTFENILGNFTSPPSNIDQSIAQYPWPPIQLIDEDFGDRLVVQISNQQRGKSKFAGSQASDPEGAYQKLLNSIHEFGTYPSVKAIAILALNAGRAGNVERVNQLYIIGCHIVAALGGDPELQIWSWAHLEGEMIGALAHAGEAKAASVYRHRLINAGHVPSANSYAALIAVVRDTTDDATIAEELYQESQRLGVIPNVYLFNTVISKLCRARKVERAMQLFNEMRQRNLHPSSVTYGALINGCTRIGDETNAKEFFTLMESDRIFKPQAPPFNTMIQFYTHTKPDRVKAMHYFNKLIERKVEPTSHTYKLLLDLHGTVEPIDIMGMEHFFGRLIADKKVSVQGTHWASIITAHGIHCGNMEMAIEIFESISEHVATKKAGSKLPDVIAYEALLNVFLNHGRTDLMHSYIDKMRQSGIQPTAYIANLMIKGLATQTEISQDGLDGLNKARSLFAEMQDPPMGVAAMGNHPPNHRHHANHSIPFDHSQQLLKNSIYGFTGVLREPSTFEAMIKAELQYGHQEEANGLLERMRERGYPPALITKAYGLVAGDSASIA